jgi:hypothetical protein
MGTLGPAVLAALLAAGGNALWVLSTGPAVARVVI